MAFGSPQWMYKSGEAYEIDQSLRFNDDDSAYLSWTPSSAGNRQVWTYSVWIKLGSVANVSPIFMAGDFGNAGGTTNNGTGLLLYSNGVMYSYWDNAAGGTTTSALLRDPSAWYHICLRADAATDGNLKLYINGELQTTKSISGNAAINSATNHNIGNYPGTGTTTFDGYMVEANFIDGQALTPADFGETGDYGEWKPKEYSGTYGTNGFYLPFKQDYAVEGFSAVTYKGNGSGQYIGGVGFRPDLTWFKERDGTRSYALYDNIRGVNNMLTSNTTAAETTDASSSQDLVSFDTDGFTLGVGYHERENRDGYTYVAWNWDMGNGSYGLPVALTANGDAMHSNTRAKFGSSSLKFDGTGDYVSAVDDPKWDLSSDFTIEFWVYPETDDNYNCFLGQGADDNNKWIIAKGGSGKIQLGFRASGTWIFGEGAGGTDAERLMGTSADCPLGSWTHIAVTRKGDKWTLWSDGDEVCSSSSSTTATFAAPFKIGQADSWGYMTGYMEELRISNVARYTSNFTAPTAIFSNDDNTLLLVHSEGSNGSTTFVDSSGATKNTTGSITSYVAANTTYGQSIVSYVGTGSDATIGHGLSSAPEMVIVKSRADTYNWGVWHTGLTSADYALQLNNTIAQSNTWDYWNDTAPSSSVFSVGTELGSNKSSSAFIAYCFHSVAGYSKFGSYIGNASTTNAITGLGFEPAFLILKNASATGDWTVWDNTRHPYNPKDIQLFPNLNNAEDSPSASTIVQFDSDGFTIKGTNGKINGSGNTIIYAAFADKREYAYWLDQSGNNNDWTSVNLTESDIMLDTPTNNFATWNPLDPRGNANTYSEGNLKVLGYYQSSNDSQGATFGVSSGKWYWETYIESATSDGGYHYVGIKDTSGYDNNYWIARGIGTKEHNTSAVSYSAASWDVDDIVGCALDMDAGNWYIYVNGTVIDSGNAVYSGINVEVTPIQASASGSNTQITVANFGQDSSFAGNKTAQGNQDGNEIGDFYYEPPTGFLALCTANLPDVAVTPSEHFDIRLRTGTGSEATVSDLEFQPDLLWTKTRSHAVNHNLHSSLMDENYSFLQTNTTEAENTSASHYYMTPTSTGYTVGTGDNINQNTRTFVDWLWKAGGGSGSSNTNGSITSTVSANVDAGFSIVSYTGSGTSGNTVGHGLSSAPELVIVKSRTTQAWMPWVLYHASLGNTIKMLLNATDASDTTSAWENTTPTSSYFTIMDSDATGTNADGENYIAYCWHSVDGYSKVGSYTGNGNADGTFVYTGFRPAFLMVKRTDATEGWYMMDAKRDIDNSIDLTQIHANSSIAESSFTAFDFTSNGFKNRTSNKMSNAVGSTYIYIAFAETPFKHANAR